MARCRPYSNNTSLTVSTSECTPSLSIAELPENAAATNLLMAISRLPPSATYTTTLVPEAVDMTGLLGCVVRREGIAAMSGRTILQCRFSTESERLR